MTKIYTISVDDGSGQKYRIHNQSESTVRELGLLSESPGNGGRTLEEPINSTIEVDRENGIIRQLDPAMLPPRRNLSAPTDEPINARIIVDRKAGIIRRV